MEIQEYLAVIKKWWWLALACVLVASVSSYVGTLQMPRIYQARTTVMVGQSLQKANPNSQDLWISQQLAQTYAEMVKRRPILEGAAQALGLSYIPSGGSVSTRQIPSTQLLEISVRDTDPARACALADEIANQLIQQSPTNNEDTDRQAFVQERLEDLETQIQTAEDEIESEQQKLEAANSARAIQQYQSNIGALQQKSNSYQATYASLLLTVQGGTNYISVIEPASTPTYPISPNVGQTVMLAAAIGLALAVGGAFLIEFLDDTIKSAQEVTRLTGLPLLGSIARIEGETYPDKLISVQHPLSTIAEAYRVLRTNVQFSSVDKPLTAISVTSPGPTEGKSVTLANLAVVMAQSGLKVVVVDTDLRRPVQHKIFSLSNTEGLSAAMLHSNPGVIEYIQKTGIENLWLLPSGPIPPNPAELLGSARLGEIIEELKGFADLLLFDSPPSLVVTDAAVLATRMDGVLIVNDAGRTRRAMVKRAIEELHHVRANLLGVVLNRLNQRDGSYYYYYNEDGEYPESRHRYLKQRWWPRLNGRKQREAAVPAE